jgi:hypothetical protein
MFNHVEFLNVKLNEVCGRISLPNESHYMVYDVVPKSLINNVVGGMTEIELISVDAKLKVDGLLDKDWYQIQACYEDDGALSITIIGSDDNEDVSSMDSFQE